MRRRDIAHLAVLGLGVLLLPFETVAGAAPGDLDRLFAEGLDRYEAGDYDGAVEAWMRLLELIPESAQHRKTRENMVLVILDARLDAVRKNQPDDALERLDDATRFVETYRADLEAVHGEGTPLGERLEWGLRDLEELRARERARNEEDPWFDVCLSPPPPPCLSLGRRGCGRRSGFDTALLGMVVAAPIVARRRDVLARVASKLPEDVARRLETTLDDDD